ncbi:helix-turn-helix protein [compost metagenome]
MKEQFSELIKTARNKKGLSQGDLATALGYSTPQFISNWERGVSAVGIHDIPLLSKLIGVSQKRLINAVTAFKISKVTKSINTKVAKAMSC